LARFVYSTNHKDIGTMYLIFAIVAVSSAVPFDDDARRADVSGLQIFAEPHTYNVFVTGHGLIMVFFMIMPAMIGALAIGSRP